MMIHFVYEECTNLFDPTNFKSHGSPRKVFFLTASRDETNKFLRHLMTQEQINVYEDWQKIPEQDDGQRCAHDDESCFVVSENLNTVCPVLRVFPTSAMWGQEHPFKEFKAEINNLDNLDKLVSNDILIDWFIYGYGIEE